MRAPTVVVSVLSVVSLCSACAAPANRQSGFQAKIVTAEPYDYSADIEAKELGYPEVYFPKTRKSTDWSRGRTARRGEVEGVVVDGPTVELCGGSCDK